MRTRKNNLVNHVQLAAAVNTAASFFLQVLILSKFSHDRDYLQLLVILNLALPFAMIFGSAAGLVFSRKHNQVSAAYFKLAKNYCLTVAAVIGIGWVIALYLNDQLSLRGSAPISSASMFAPGIIFGVSVGSMLSQILSAQGYHISVLSVSLLPNIAAIASVAALGNVYGALSYSLAWSVGSAATLFYFFSKLGSALGQRNETQASFREYHEVLKVAPTFLIFGAHQFLDGLILGAFSIGMLPAIAFIHRVVIGLWNIAASRDLSITIEEFSNCDQQNLQSNMDRLLKRVARIIGVGLLLCCIGVVGARLWRSLLIMQLGQNNRVLVENIISALPAYVLGGSAMIGVSCVMRAQVLLGRVKATYTTCVVLVLIYILLINASRQSSIVEISIAYALSWFAALAFLMLDSRNIQRRAGSHGCLIKTR